jgi:hypothetical protein
MVLIQEQLRLRGIALPLIEAGLRVDGIELSQPMVDRMRESRAATASR